MRILALDTATEACSAALLMDGETLERYQVAPREHANMILSLLDELLTEGGVTLTALNAIAVTRGPGSFTGVRIGVSVAQGLATGAGLGILPVSTLHCIAFQAHLDQDVARVIAALDARMGEIYCAGYAFDESALGRETFSERVCPPSLDLDHPDDWYAAGPGFAAYPDLAATFRASDREAQRFPRAGAAARLAADALESGAGPIAPEDLEPTYLRNRVAAKPVGR